jgi:hypothetical protein
MTTLDLVTAVLLEIGVIASDETPSAQDGEFVKNRYVQWRRLAERRGLVDWYGDEELIPDGAELGVTYCVAFEVFSNFNVPMKKPWRDEGETFLHDYIADPVPSPQTAMTNF